MSEKFKLEGDWAELWQKVCLLRQSWTKYLKQNRKIQKNWTGQQWFDYTFKCVLNAIVKL